jgi:hypothetical protein
MEPVLTDQERSELERQLWRCRGKAHRITGTGRSADPEYAQEFLAALGSLRQRAEAIAGGAVFILPVRTDPPDRRSGSSANGPQQSTMAAPERIEASHAPISAWQVKLSMA